MKLKEDKRSKVIKKASEIAGSHTSQVEKVLYTKKAIEKEGPLDLAEMEKIKEGFEKMEKYQVFRVSSYSIGLHIFYLTGETIEREN